ncbi:hypothetical protein Syun_014283 [Stephania yunnanensis]|uniref:Histone-lysine N-methyltransferase ASHH2 n=1 Tax=Stephania yunnanensis TaxID=152371 RepID=A0AAP0JJ11_9MAGN
MMVGSCGISDVGDEWAGVEIGDGELGVCLGDARMGLFDEVREFEKSEADSCGRFSAVEAPELLFGGDRNGTDEVVVPKDLCLEGTCSVSSEDAVIGSQLGDIVSFGNADNADCSNAGIDEKVPLASSVEPKHDDEMVVMPVSDEEENGKCLDVELCESGGDEEKSSLVSTKEACLDGDQTQFEDKMEKSTENREAALPLSSEFLTSTSTCTHLGNSNINENLVDCSEATDSGILEDAEKQHHFSSGTDLITKTLHGERATAASEGFLGVSTSSQLCQPCLVLEENFSLSLVSDDQKRDDCGVALSSGGLFGSVLQSDSIEKGNAKPDTDLMLTCSGSLRSSHQRSARQCKSNKKSGSRNTKKQVGKTNSKKLFSGKKTEISLQFTRRKRSFQRKAERVHEWGQFRAVVQVFPENDSLLKQDTQLFQIENCCLKRRNKIRGTKKRKKAQPGGSSPVANRKNSASTGRIRLRVKVGGGAGKNSLEVVFPEDMGSQASLPSFVGECEIERNGEAGTDFSKFTNKVVKLVDNGCATTHLGGTLELPESGYLVDSDNGDKSLGSAVTLDASVGNGLSNCPGVAFQRGVALLDEVVDNQYSYPGTSPDSEVVNSVQDAGIGAQLHEEVDDTVLSSSHELCGLVDEEALRMGSKKNKGKKNGKVKERRSICQGKRKDPRNLSKCRDGREIGRIPTPGDTFVLGKNDNSSLESSGIEAYSIDIFPGLETVELGEMSNVGNVSEDTELSARDVPAKASKSIVKSVGSRTNKCSKFNVERRKKKSCASESLNGKGLARVQKEDVKGFASENGIHEDGVLDKDFNGESHPKTSLVISDNHHEPGRVAELSEINALQCNLSDDLGKQCSGSKSAPVDTLNSSSITDGLNGQFLPSQKAWVSCDECHKWRCISVELANSIEHTGCRWTCNDNMDKAFADCSVPQEKTNAEINAELQISDEEDAAFAKSEGCKGKQLTVPRLAPWKSIRSNLFLHRSRKTQTIDEIMVCHCKPHRNGNLGCRDSCLNRILNIECVKGTCPCGDLCSNQQFQKRKYAKLKCLPCGKKGHGLKLLEDVSRGAFLIEYVGEVLDLNAYEARQKEYAAKGQKHFYFMTLNGSEVIDACAKGNLGRFINHSCDPNCRTEKWMVNGEVCIGLFAVRDIKKGEEVTFDYNYVRVFGAAAKRCICGSAECRGYLGGDPLNTDVVLDDSDEEYPEPVMVEEDGENDIHVDKMIPDVLTMPHNERVVDVSDVTIQSPSTIELSVDYSREEDAMENLKLNLGQAKESLHEEESWRSSAIHPLDVQKTSALKPPETTFQEQEEHASNKNIRASQPSELSSITNLASSAATVNKLNCEEHKPSISKPFPLTKSSRPACSIKRGKTSSNPLASDKHQVLTNKPKKMPEGVASSRHDGVEEKLKDLLDSEGGISKRKDATKGYLKLLVLTAASGDNVNGEAFQSTRDLSIILEALLKTKSRTVLVDIINKNGLQMLHNIMKQNSRNFSRTPIIRKLLKVLEFMAQREILTLEHINSSPPCAGMQSFKDSIIELTWHNDSQVYQSARSFRDKWFPRTNKRNTYLDRDDNRFEQRRDPNNWHSTPHRWRHDQGGRHTEGIDCISHTMSTANSLDNNLQEPTHSSLTMGRKRKSRWDQPSETKQNQVTPDVLQDHRVKQKLESSIQQLEIKLGQQQVTVVDKEKIFTSCNCSLSQQTEASCNVDEMRCNHEDAPPGFPSPIDSDLVPSDASTPQSANCQRGQSACKVTTGNFQERYLAHLPVSYGIPLPFVDRLGIGQNETSDSWTVAPSIPFHPFPPLPPFPRDVSKFNPPPSDMTMNGSHDVKLEENHGCTPLQEDQVTSDMSWSRPSDRAVTGASIQNDKAVIGASSQHAMLMRGVSDHLDRRYFRQQKKNNFNNDRPWHWRRNQDGVKASNFRNRGPYLRLGNVEHKGGGFSCSESVSDGREHISSTLYQHQRGQRNH